MPPLAGKYCTLFFYQSSMSEFTILHSPVPTHTGSLYFIPFPSPFSSSHGFERPSQVLPTSVSKSYLTGLVFIISLSEESIISNILLYTDINTYCFYRSRFLFFNHFFSVVIILGQISYDYNFE